MRHNCCVALMLFIAGSTAASLNAATTEDVEYERRCFDTTGELYQHITSNRLYSIYGLKSLTLSSLFALFGYSAYKFYISAFLDDPEMRELERERKQRCSEFIAYCNKPSYAPFMLDDEDHAPVQYANDTMKSQLLNQFMRCINQEMSKRNELLSEAGKPGIGLCLSLLSVSICSEGIIDNCTVIPRMSSEEVLVTYSQVPSTYITHYIPYIHVTRYDEHGNQVFSVDAYEMTKEQYNMLSDAGKQMEKRAQQGKLSPDVVYYTGPYVPLFISESVDNAVFGAIA